MSIRCCDSRGLSLVEVLISAGLVLLVLGLGTSFLIPLMRMQVDGAESAELGQRSTMLLEELRRDLNQSSAAGLTLLQSEQEVLLAIHASDNVAQDGTLVWKDSLVIYHWTSASKQWRRGVWRDQPRRVLRAAAPTRLSEDDLRQAATEVVISRITPGLTTVSFQQAEGGPLGQLPITVRLAMISPAGETRQVTQMLGGRLPTL
jgi:hypothetical protein